MQPEGRALAIAALLRMHPPSVVAKMVRDLDAGKSPADVTLNAYRISPSDESQKLTLPGETT